MSSLQDVMRWMFPSWYREEEENVPRTRENPYEFDLGNQVHITVLNGDISETEADVAVVANNASLQTTSGEAASVLEKAGGPPYRNALSLIRERRELDPGKILVLDAAACHRLSSERVYHAIMSKLYRQSSSPEWNERLKFLYGAVCKEMEKHEVKVAATVLIGTGQAGGPVVDSVQAALTAFASIPPSAEIQRIIIVENNGSKARDIIAQCKTWLEQHPQGQRDPERPAAAAEFQDDDDESEGDGGAMGGRGTTRGQRKRMLPKRK